MTVTVEELRRKYPNPEPFTQERDQIGYCVGGALCLEDPKTSAMWRRRFPSLAGLGNALLDANPGLEIGDAVRIAYHIIAENDAGNTDVAWAWLDKGLTA